MGNFNRQPACRDLFIVEIHNVAWTLARVYSHTFAPQASRCNLQQEACGANVCEYTRAKARATL